MEQIEGELVGTEVVLESGGSSDYQELENKPQINGVELVGDKSAAELGLASAGDIPVVNDGKLTIQKNGTDVGEFSADASSDTVINISVPTSARDVGALADNTKYGASIELSINSSTYVVTVQLKDQDGNALGAAQTIDLPLESVVVGGSYDSVSKEVVLTLQNGSVVRFSIADLVAGLVPSTRTVAGVDLQDDITKSEMQGALEDSTHRFVSDAEKGDWNGKQNALVSGENIKSINDESVLGAGNLQVGYPVLEGVGEPTGATAGKVNQLYRDTATNKVYICGSVTTESDVTSYEWQAVGGSGKYLHIITLNTYCSGRGAGSTTFSGSCYYSIIMTSSSSSYANFSALQSDLQAYITANNSILHPVYNFSDKTSDTTVRLVLPTGMDITGSGILRLHFKIQELTNTTITINGTDKTVVTGWSTFLVDTKNMNVANTGLVQDQVIAI